jgi:hypothetical protein
MSQILTIRDEPRPTLEQVQRALGRVAIDDEERALEFVGDDAPLLEAVRKLKDTGDRGVLDERKFQSSQRIERAKRLRERLLGP